MTFETWYNNTGLNNGNTLIGFGGPIDVNSNGTNFINFFARWPSSQTAFQIDTLEGNSGVLTLGSRQQNGTFHWVLSYDPVAGNVTLYLNGAYYGSASGVNIPLSTVGTAVGYIGLSTWNQQIALQGYGFNSNGNYPYLNANVDEMRIYDGILNTNAIAATQLLGPNTLLSNTATLGAVSSPGSLTLVWPIVNGAFTLQSTPVLGPKAVWTAVPGTKTVIGTNYELTVSSTNATAFFRLSQ